MAAASFLIAALSAFHLDAARQAPRWQAATAPSAWLPKPTSRSIKTSTVPKAAPNWAFPPMMKNNLPECGPLPCGSNRATTPVVSICTGLRQPRLLGLPPQFIDRGGFAWAKVPRKCGDPWKLLQLDFGQDPDGTPVVPVILEKNTANYSLNLWRGPGETFDISDAQGKKIRLQVVALLANSIFQGDLLLDEAALLRYFPQVAGYRFFLFETPPDKTKTVQAILERTLGDYGFAAETTAQRTAGFLAVQNTYLSTFQSLGGLGLLLGTLGLAAVQLRNVVERRGELALLRAAGFRRRRLAGLVLLETLFLLLAGLACGIVAAFVAILPHLITHDASIPWLSLSVTLALVLIVGLLSGLIASARVLRAPLLAALREER